MAGAVWRREAMNLRQEVLRLRQANETLVGENAELAKALDALTAPAPAPEVEKKRGPGRPPRSFKED